MSHRRPKTILGSVIERQTLPTAQGGVVTFPDQEQIVHLQFRRYAACPICNLHLRSFIVGHDRLTAAGIVEIVVFPSTIDDMRPYQGDLPFAAIPDPERRLFSAFGVERSVRSVLDPRAWPAALRGIASFGIGVPRRRESPFGLPADFLIAPSGLVLAAHYGAHADDQWSVQQVIALSSGLIPSSGS
jgi:peroxiredoxin